MVGGGIGGEVKLRAPDIREFVPMFNSARATEESIVEQVVTVAGILSHFNVKIVAPGNSPKRWDFWIRRNGKIDCDMFHRARRHDLRFGFTQTAIFDVNDRITVRVGANVQSTGRAMNWTARFAPSS